MSLFKEQVAADIAATFINFSEFATEHVIDDENVLIVLDSDVKKERYANNFEDGTYLKLIAFFMEESELSYRPVENQHIVFDGHPGIVASCEDEDGLLYVVIELNMS